MNKEEFLIMSLRHGLKVKLNQIGKFNLDEEYPEPHEEICEVVNVLRSNPWDYEISDGNISYGYIGIEEFNLILHPLSDLSKEIIHKDEKFIPINKIGEIFKMNTVEYNFFEQNAENKDFIIDNIRFCIVLKLIEWHFDIAGLIEKHQGTNVNELKINPYK